MSDYDGRLAAGGENLTAPLQDQDTAELLDLLCDTDEATRHAAAMVLQGRGGREAFDRAMELVQGDRAECRDTAAFLLGQFGYRSGFPFRDRSVPVLISLLADDPCPQVRASAAAALGQLDAVCALEALIRAAEDGDPQVRLAAAAALGRLALPECIPVLQRLRDDCDLEVAEWALTGMEMLVGRQLDGASGDELLVILREAGREPLHRQVAADIFAQRDGAAARDCGFRLSADADERMRCSAAYLLSGAASWHRELRHEVIPFLADMLRHESSGSVRVAAAEGLAQLGETVVRASLERAASGSDAEMRSAAAWGLKRISSGDYRTTPLFDRLLAGN